MDKRFILIGLFALLFIAGCSEDGGVDYEIIGNSVQVDDSNIYISVSPHTIHYSDWVEVEFESKLFSGNIDFVFGFNTADGVYPITARRWVEQEQIYSNETTYYNCEHEFNYTQDPNHFWCYNQENGTLIYDHDFNGGSLGEQTAWWQELEYSNWVDWKPDNSVDYDFLDMDKWYYSKNQNIIANKVYKIKYYLEVPYNAPNGKYVLAIKPSSETVEEAIDNEHFWYLDPWYTYPSLDTNLLAFFSFDDDTLLGDITKQGRNATINGTPSRDATAKFNQSYGFPHADDKLGIISDMSFTEGITVAGWYESIDGQAWASYLWGSNDLVFNTYVDVVSSAFKSHVKGTTLATTSLGTSTAGYIFVATTYDETNVKMYIGNATDLNTYSDAESDDLGTTGSFYIGDHFDTADNSMADGFMDEIGIWNRSLSATEIGYLWNAGSGIRYNPAEPPDLSIDSLQIAPSTIYATTGDLNGSAFIYNSNGNNYNVTINWTNSTDFISQNIQLNKLNGTYSSFNLTGHQFTSGEVINLTMYAIGTDAELTNSTTITVSDTAPTWVDAPTNLTVFHTSNITLDYNCTDIDGVETYNISNYSGDLSTPLTIDNESGYINNNPTYDDVGSYDYNVTCSQGSVSINQTLNITVNQNTNFSYKALKDPVSEGANQMFYLDIFIQNYSGIPSLTPVLQFNGTDYVGALINSGTDGNINYWNFTTDSITILNTSGSVSGVKQSFNWTFNLTDILSTDFETSSKNVTVYKMGIDDCSTHNQTILNMTLKDEENNSGIAGDIGIDLTIRSWEDYGVAWNYNNSWTNSTGNRTRALVCVPANVLNESSYMIYITTSYISEVGAQEFWFLDYGNLSSLSTFNSYTPKIMDLFSLDVSDSTSFLMRYVDVDGLKEEDIIINAYRRYIGEGLFREVERGRQNDEGETELHLVEEDVIYYFVVTQNGTIRFTSNQFQATCQAVPCAVDLEAGGDFVPFGTDWDLVSDGGFSVTSDGSAREVMLTFTASNSSQWNLTLYKYNNDPDQATLVNESYLTSTSGTVTVYAPVSAGNITYVARVQRDDVFLRDSFVSFGNNQLATFQTAGGVILGALFVIAMVMMASTQGIAVVIFAVLGIVLVGILKLIELNWIAFILLLTMAGIIIWKLTRRTD